MDETPPNPSAGLTALMFDHSFAHGSWNVPHLRFVDSPGGPVGVPAFSYN